MAVSEQSPLNQYTANGVTTVFAFSFLLLQAADLTVTVNGVESTLGIDYTVSGLGVASGGSVTFLTAPANGAKVVAFRDSALSRSTDYQDNGDLLADTVNLDFDRLWMVMQEIYGGGKGSPTALRVPNGETVSALPAAASRANMVLAFDSVGNPIVSIPASGTAADVLVTVANTTDPAKGVGAVGLGAGVAYPSGGLGDQALAIRALRKGRTAPHANFNWFTADFTVTGCAGPGRATVQQDIYDVWMTKYSGSMTGGTTYVDGTNGSDANIGTIAAPWQTIDKALRTSVSGLTLVMPGSYESNGFRYSDTQGDRPKMLVAPYGGVTIKTSGDTISAATFAANGTFPNVYETTLVSTNYVIRVLHSGKVDKLGLPMPMPKAASLADLNSLGYGWWYDSATRKLYVRHNNENVNTVTKSSLSAVYATGGDNSIIVNSAKLYLENITLQKYISVLKTSGQAVPECWMKNCTVRYAESNSRSVSGGGMYSQGCTYYRSTADHANYNTSLGTTAYGVEINDLTYFAGDVDTFTVASGAQANNPIATGQIKNSSSNHDGYVVRINGVHDGAFGPVIADTDTSYSWNIGVSCGYSYALTTSKYGWIVQGSSAKAWLDGCSAGPGNSGINSDTSAVTYTFNTAGAQVTSSSGSFSAYVPA